MPWNLLILPLLGGFWLLRTCNLFRFRSQYLEGYRLLMESAIAGVVLIGLGRLNGPGPVGTCAGRFLP